MFRDSAARRFLSSRAMGERIEGERPQSPAGHTTGAPAPLTDEARSTRALFPDGAAKHWLLSSIIWLTVVDLFGLVLATEFVSPEAFGGIPWLTFSRIRPAHVNGVILAWLTMMYFGALFYMLPRLVGTRGMWSERLGIVCAWAWNLMYLLGIIGLLTGHSQGREYGEFIWPIDIAAARHLVRERREHPRDGRDPDDPADLRLRLVLHREPALAGRRLRDRQRDLASGPHLGRAVGCAQPEPLGRDPELVVRPQPVRALADADAAGADLLHRPARHQHAALQLHALADQFLGDGVLLHRASATTTSSSRPRPPG